MKIKAKELPSSVLNAIKNPDYLSSEDIFIEDDDGKIIAAILQPDDYAFFIKKIREREDEVDRKNTGKYDPSAKSLEDILKDLK